MKKQMPQFNFYILPRFVRNRAEKTLIIAKAQQTGNHQAYILKELP